MLDYRSLTPTLQCFKSNFRFFISLLHVALAVQIKELRKASEQLPFDYLVVLVGDTVTEEALPSYMNMLNTLDATRVSRKALLSL